MNCYWWTNNKLIPPKLGSEFFLFTQKHGMRLALASVNRPVGLGRAWHDKAGNRWTVCPKCNAYSHQLGGQTWMRSKNTVKEVFQDEGLKLNVINRWIVAAFHCSVNGLTFSIKTLSILRLYTLKKRFSVYFSMQAILAVTERSDNVT